LQQTVTTSVQFVLRLNNMVHMFFLLDVCEALVVSLNHKLLCLPPVLLLPSDSSAELCGVSAAIAAAVRVEL
jgi:hypothetical protein